MDPVALLGALAGAVPAVAGAMAQIVAYLRVNHPALDTTPLELVAADRAEQDARDRAVST